MSAPVVMSVEQVPAEGYAQHMMVPCCFVAMPEFCEGMQLSPSAPWQPMWPQAPRRGQSNSWHKQRNTPAPRSGYVPQEAPPPMFWAQPQQSNKIEEPTAIELSNLPSMLCNRMCLEASIEQAGLESDVQGITVESGKATITLATERAAEQCIRHFHGLRWKSSEPVLARYCLKAGEDNFDPPKTRVTEAKPSANPKKITNKPAEKPKSPSPTKTSDRSPPASPFSTCSTKAPSLPSTPSMRPRWADVDSDDEDDDTFDKWSKSTGAEEAQRDSTSESGNSSNTEC